MNTETIYDDGIFQVCAGPHIYSYLPSVIYIVGQEASLMWEDTPDNRKEAVRFAKAIMELVTIMNQTDEN